MTSAITAAGLRKSFGGKIVLDGIDLEVGAGTTFSLLDPDGAGQTTTAINTGQGPGHYVNYQLPGILLITITTGISYTTLRLYADMHNGIFERFQSLPIARSSVLWAHVLTSVVSTLISLVIVVLIALPVGFRSGAGAPAWLAVAGIAVLLTLALTWIAVIAGLSAKTAEAGAPTPTRSSSCRSSARHSCPPAPCPARCAPSPTTSP